MRHKSFYFPHLTVSSRFSSSALQLLILMTYFEVLYHLSWRSIIIKSKADCFTPARNPHTIGRPNSARIPQHTVKFRPAGPSHTLRLLYQKSSSPSNWFLFVKLSLSMGSSHFPRCLLPETAPPQGSQHPGGCKPLMSPFLPLRLQGLLQGKDLPYLTLHFHCPPPQSRCPVDAGYRCWLKKKVRNTVPQPSPDPRLICSHRIPSAHRRHEAPPERPHRLLF